jgi:outer membrane protein assembly factor BamB
VRFHTAVVALAALAALAGVVVLGVAAPGGGTLAEQWVSDTPRNNSVNHHAVGVGPTDEVVLAPVAEVPRGETPDETACALVRLARDGGVRWRAAVPPANCTTHALTEPAVADVDGDGQPEAALSTTEDALLLRDGATGEEQWRVPLSTYGYGRPTVADLTGDGAPEIVTSDIGANVVAATAAGEVRWRTDLNATDWRRPTVWDRPLVLDADADGQREVVVGANRGPAVLAADGSVVWRQDGSATYLARAGADADPAVEILTAGDGTVRAYDGATGAVEWTRSVASPRIRETADLTGDGRPEVVVGAIGGRVLALDAADGTTVWESSLSVADDVTVAPPVVGNVTGDTPAVVAATKAGTVAVLDGATGRELAAYERSVPVWTFPTLADLDDDADEEILVRYGDGRVVALDYR